MGWDASRPVPWRRMVKEWLIYAGIMTVVFFLIFRESAGLLGIIAGLLISGPLYLGLGYVLAKFGYQRKTLAELRTPRAAPAPGATTDGDHHRARPAPTRRTAGGTRHPAAKGRRRR